MSELKRKAYVAAGLATIVAGIVIAPLPGPGGLPVIAVGTIILLRNSGWARKGFVKLKQRYPMVMSPLVMAVRWRRRKKERPNPDDDAPQG